MSETDYSYDETTTISSGDSAISKSDGNNNNNNNSNSNPKKLNNSSHSSMVSFGEYGEYGVVYALKSIVLDHVTDNTFIKELQNEIAILRTLDHPNICKAIETYEFNHRMYLVLELCSGGDLYERDPYDEWQAKYIVRSILDACAYLHRKKITHRDRKYCIILYNSANVYYYL